MKTYEEPSQKWITPETGGKGGVSWSCMELLVLN
jgi:hypothetical protein